jgi:hypothetical protein
MQTNLITHSLTRTPLYCNYCYYCCCTPGKPVNMATDSLVLVHKVERITVVTINRPTKRNCVDRPTATALATAFRQFDQDNEVSIR